MDNPIIPWTGERHFPDQSSISGHTLYWQLPSQQFPSAPDRFISAQTPRIIARDVTLGHKGLQDLTTPSVKSSLIKSWGYETTTVKDS